MAQTPLRTSCASNIYIHYILGQLLVSSAAPHLILPIIVNFNQRRSFLLMNRSHLSVESANVGVVVKILHASGYRCVSQSKNLQAH